MVVGKYNFYIPNDDLMILLSIKVDIGTRHFPMMVNKFFNVNDRNAGEELVASIRNRTIIDVVFFYSFGELKQY